MTLSNWRSQAKKADLAAQRVELVALQARHARATVERRLRKLLASDEARVWLFASGLLISPSSEKRGGRTIQSKLLKSSIWLSSLANLIRHQPKRADEHNRS